MITKLGREKLESHIAELQKELERTFKERSEAAAEGDLRENSAYIFQGERAQVLMSQIEEAKMDLKQETVQTAPAQTNTITFGHQVSLLFENDQRQITVTLVGKHDARLKPDWISIDSPIGQSLLGRHKSDLVSVNGQPVRILDIGIGDI